jgi:hypothetical protein
MKTFACGGTIEPARFVKRSTAADFTVLQADANSFPCGISQAWAQDAPIPGAATAAGKSGDQIQVHQPGMSGEGQDSTVWLVCGASVTRGSLLMPDADGKGITCTTGKYYGALADESGASGEKIRVTPISGILA